MIVSDSIPQAAFNPWGFSVVLGVLSLALHRDLLPRFASAVPSDLGDPLLNMWILWWNAWTIPFTAQYWNAPSFAPAPYALALSETLLGLTWLTTPLQWVGASPVVAYNVLVLATLVLNGLSMHWLCLTLTGRRDAAVIGGLAYAFAPYHAHELPHVQTQAMFWMPVALVGLHRYWDTGGRRWLVCLAAGTAFNGYTCGYFLLYFAVLLGLAIVWLTIASGTLRKLGEVGVALLAALVALAPVILVYRSVRTAWNLRRPFYEVESFGADLLLFVAGADRLSWWPISTDQWRLQGQGYSQYPGIVILVVLLAAGVVAWRRRRARPRPRWRGIVAAVLGVLGAAEVGAAMAYWIVGPWALMLGPIELTMSHPLRAMSLAIPLLLLAAVLAPRFTAALRAGSIPALYATGAVVTSLLALGPVARLNGGLLWRQAPYAWLMWLPGFDATRAPALFAAITALCLAVLAAYAMVRLVSRPGTRSHAFVTIVAAAIVADGWAVVPVVDVPPPIRTPLSGELVVELPLGVVSNDVAAMYRGMAHGRRVVNGYSGYITPHYEFLFYDLAKACLDSLEVTRRGRSLDVVLWVGTEAARRFDVLLAERWGRDVREEFAGTIVYHLPGEPGAPPAGTFDAEIDTRSVCEDRPAP